MEFSNLYFLYIWLPLVMLVYFLVRGTRLKNMVLIGFSLFFYAMGQPVYLLLLIGLTYANFQLAQRIRRDDRVTVVLPVAINIGVLALFKYLDFLLGLIGIVSQDGVILGALKGIVRGLNNIGFSFQEPVSAVPVGISFFTFSIVSYLLDVYRGKIPAEKRFSHLLLYVSLFPKLLQGPIVRYEQLRPQLFRRKVNYQNVYTGALRFTVGLSKKVLLADYCGKVISELASVGSDTSFVGAWLAAVLFMFQIYFDFSGYSDMAIGLGRVFGFTFCENFNLPYTSTSITEFWRRWHMSLGSFFKDYVYIPLGGNRKGWARQILNLLAVWALTGLWHGANWNYVLWGLYFFGLLVAEKHFMPQLEKLPKVLRHVITLILLLFGWVIFSNESMADLGAALGGMFGFGGFAATGVQLKLLNSLPLLIVCLIGCTPLPRGIASIFIMICDLMGGEDEAMKPRRLVCVIVGFVFMAVLLWLCTVSLVGNTSAPSIYGNF